MAYTKSSTERYESTSKTSYSHSSRKSTSKSTSSSSHQRQGIESRSKNRSYDFDEDNFIESYLQAERREIGTTPITFKSVQSPRASRKQMQSSVKDGFQKVTVTSGSNKIDHFGKSNTFSSDEDDDVFVPAKNGKRQNQRRYVDEDIIVAQDASGYDMSGERSFEEVYGTEKTAQFQKGQQLNFHFDISKQNDQSNKRSTTPEITVEQYETPPAQRKKAWEHQQVDSDDDDRETVILALATDENEVDQDRSYHHKTSQQRRYQQRQEYSDQHSMSPRDQPSFKQEKKTHHIYVKNMSQKVDHTDSSREITVPIDVTQKNQNKKFHVKDLPIDITVERGQASLSEPQNIRVLVSPTPQQNFGFVPVHKHSVEQQHHHHHHQKTYDHNGSYQNQQQSTTTKVKTKPTKHAYQTNDEAIVVNVYESFKNVDKDLYDGNRGQSQLVTVQSQSRPSQQTYEYHYTGYSDKDNSVSTAHVRVKNSAHQSVMVENERRREELERMERLRQEEIEIQRQQKEIYERQQRIEQRKREEMERREEEERRLIQQQRQQEAYQQRLREEAMLRRREEERIQRERMIREEEERKRLEQVKIEEERQRHLQEKKLQEERFQRQVMEAESRRKAEEEYQMQQYSKNVQRSQSQRYATTESQNVVQNYQSVGTFPRKLKKRQQQQQQQQYMSRSVTNTPNQARKFGNYPYSASNTPEVRRRGMSDSDSNPNAILGRTDMGKQSVMVSRVVRPKSVDPTMQTRTLPRNFERTQDQNWMVETGSENQSKTTTVRNVISSTSSYQQTSRTTRHGSSSKASYVQRPQSTTAVDDARLAEAQRKYLAKHALLEQNQQTFLGTKSNEHSSTAKIIRPIPFKQPANKGFMPISSQEFVPQQQSQKGHMVQYSDHSKVKIISGSHLHSNAAKAKHVHQSEQIFNRNQQTNKSVQSKAYTNLYRPCPHVAPVNIPTQKEQPPQRKKSSNEKYESIKVVAKGGVITLSMEEEDKSFTDAEKQRLVSSVYEKQYHQDSSYSEQRYNQSSNMYQSYNYQDTYNDDTYNDDWYQTNNAKLLSLKEGNPQFPTENIYYTVCTRYFKPENNDWITSIHRMGKAKVPAEGNHRNKCVFWLQLYDPDKEDIVVQKIIPPDYDSGMSSGNYQQRYDDNNNYVGDMLGNGYEAFDMTQNHQQKSTYSNRHQGNASFDSDGESRASSVYSFDSKSSRKRSKPKLLRKSRENPGLYKQEQNDYKKYMPINQTVY